MADSQRRTLRPRGPGFVFTALATAVLLAVGVVALNASQAPLATVAEFAPAALDQIKVAPPRQASDVGTGKDGAAVAGGASPSATASASAGASAGPSAQPSTGPAATRAASASASASAAASASVSAAASAAAASASASAAASPSGPPDVIVPRQHSCVGDPPRQIDDPQSPPCVPFFTGDNGGATAPGVTRDEIRVAAPFGTFFTGDPTPQYQAIVNYFNSHFEFYGRKIRLLTYAARGDNFAYPNPPDMIADATQVADSLHAFASLGYPDRKGAEHTYYDELARRKVIAVVGRDTALGTESYYAARDPYEWTRGTTVDTQFRNYGQFLCASLADKAPQYGGPPYPFTPQPTVRSFGVLVNQATDGTKPDPAPLLSALAACGVKPFVETAPETMDARDAVNPVLQMIQQKVTSVICICDVGSARDYLTAASGQSYRPEWLMGTYLNNDLDNSFSNSTPEQAKDVLGITFSDKLLRVSDQPWYTALRQGDPSVPVPGNNGPISFYQNLLLLASGIQMAGPNLSPATFAAALHRTVFPDPGAGAAPFYQATVGFPGSSHAMRIDAAMYWYDPTRSSVADPTSNGRVCYVGKGTRFSVDHWPNGDPAFQDGVCG